MEVILKKQFIKELIKLPAKVQNSVREILEILENSVNLETSGVDFKKMEGQRKDENYYRIRVGQWRIGIEYREPSLVVITILSRGDIYKHFPQN